MLNTVTGKNQGECNYAAICLEILFIQNCSQWGLEGMTTVAPSYCPSSSWWLWLIIIQKVLQSHQELTRPLMLRSAIPKSCLRHTAVWPRAYSLIQESNPGPTGWVRTDFTAWSCKPSVCRAPTEVYGNLTGTGLAELGLESLQSLIYISHQLLNS